MYCIVLLHVQDKLTKLLNAFLRFMFVLNNLRSALMKSMPFAGSIKLSLIVNFKVKKNRKTIQQN